jgi:ABC-type phosphate transport system auxiliary subunit
MAEFKKGYDLGKKIEHAECDRISKEWGKLEKEVSHLINKKDADKTEREKQLELYHDLFGEAKVFETTNVTELDDKLADGFEKAILEKTK